LLLAQARKGRLGLPRFAARDSERV
jgi:hypothetical protein